jgi:hypothetical protein
MSDPVEGAVQEPGVPKKIDSSFLAHVMQSTTSYSEGWRDVCTRLWWAETEITAIQIEQARLKHAISPRRASDWTVEQLASLAECHREDSETQDRHDHGDSYGSQIDYDAVSLERQQRLITLTSSVQSIIEEMQQKVERYGEGLDAVDVLVNAITLGELQEWVAKLQQILTPDRTETRT